MCTAFLCLRACNVLMSRDAADLLLQSWMVRLVRATAGDLAAARLITKRLPDVASLFDGEWYLGAYPDVRDSGYDPLVHYMAFGAAEGRNPHPLFDAPYYRRQHPGTGENPLVHYVRDGILRRYGTHPERGFCLIPPLGRPIRILTLLVRYGSDKYKGAAERLEELLSRTLPGAQRRTVIIDNALPAGFQTRLGGDRTSIGGDNTWWEFSGWDRGIEFMAHDLPSFDFVHFATDAYEQLGAAFAERVNLPMLEALRFGPAIAGHIDAYNEPAGLFGCIVQSWVRSSYFFLRPAEVKALGSMVSVRDKDSLFTGDPARPLRPGSPVSGTLAAYLTDWLTGEGVGQGVQWHSRFELNERTLPLFETKAVAILNELMLSERLRSLGCWMADVTWLRAVLEGSSGRLFETDWRSQVGERIASAM
jgi:hypothetical protein